MTDAAHWRLAAVAVASSLALAGALAWPADVSAPSRVALPSPTLGDAAGTPTALASDQALTLRVYLSGQNPSGRVAQALAVSDPTGQNYARFLTPAQFEQRYGPTSARTWLTSQGMTITSTSQHYITVNATVAQAREVSHIVAQPRQVSSSSLGPNTASSRSVEAPDLVTAMSISTSLLRVQ